MTREIVLITNIWNERTRIPRLFQMVEGQTVPPKLWVWFDDGSNDGSDKVIIEHALRSPIPVMLYYTPMKDKGNMDTIGRAYQRFIPRLHHLDFDYMTILDVDSQPDSDFFETQCRLMECNPDAGITGGQTDKDPLRTSSIMGLGMFIRWTFIRRIKRWWDFSPDSMLNTLAVFAGYTRLLVNDLIITAAPSDVFHNPKSGFNFGRYACITDVSFLLILRRVQGRIRRKGIRDGIYFLSGYLSQLTKPYRLNYKEITMMKSRRIKHLHVRSETLAEALCTGNH